MSAHTPTPWVYDPTLPYGIYSDDATGSRIATTDKNNLVGRSSEENAANAAFIVTACNAYYGNQAEIAKLRDENDRLREAMNQIAEMANWQIGVPTDTEAANEHARIAHTMAETARASALAKEPTP